MENLKVKWEAPIYPEPLQKGDYIGITATSCGVQDIFLKRLDNSIKQLRDLGYECIETPSVRNNYKLTSGSSEVRAKEFLSLYRDERVKLIIPPWGGELLMDMLPHIDFEEIKNLPPKWVMGFSDTSTLLFTLAVKCNIATAHGPNAMDFGTTPIDESVLNALNLLSSSGEIKQSNLEYFQKEWPDIEGNEIRPYNLSEKVQWKLLNSGESCSFQGRLIGGNLDVICKLIGTPFAPVEAFINNYREDGFIWYFESCNMDSTDIYRTLWQMNLNGWFINCRGFIFGRAEGYEDAGDFNFVDSLMYPLADLKVPIIYDADLGHLPPQLTFINGALASVRYESGKCSIFQQLI